MTGPSPSYWILRNFKRRLVDGGSEIFSRAVEHQLLFSAVKNERNSFGRSRMACDELDDAVRELGAENLKYILLTHGHFDHIGGAAYYQRMTHGKIVMFYLESRFAADGALNLGKSFILLWSPFSRILP